MHKLYMNEPTSQRPEGNRFFDQRRPSYPGVYTAKGAHNLAQINMEPEE